MRCPDEHELLDLIEGRMAVEPATDLQRHLDECPSCTELVASFGALLVEDTGPRDDAPLRPGDLVDRYEIQSLLGTGGMGQVYTARDPDLDRLVALKLVR